MFKPIANFFKGVAAKLAGRKPAVAVKSATEKLPETGKLRTPKLRGARKTRSTDGFHAGQIAQLFWANHIKQGMVIAVHADKVGILHSHGTISWRTPSEIRV